MFPLAPFSELASPPGTPIFVQSTPLFFPGLLRCPVPQSRLDRRIGWRLAFFSFMSRFADRLVAEGLQLRRARPEILQVNVGKLCNLTCMHCHVNAGPKRKEIMTRETIDRVIDWLSKSEITILDLPASAPHMIPHFPS